jgi:hypothetical protein
MTVTEFDRVLAAGSSHVIEWRRARDAGTGSHR